MGFGPFVGVGRIVSAVWAITSRHTGNTKERSKNNFRTSPPASRRWKEVWELAAVVVKPVFRGHEASGDGRETGKLFVGRP